MTGKHNAPKIDLTQHYNGLGPNTTFGTWTLLERLQGGATAKVFRAQGPNGITALKVYDPRIYASQRTRFEARLKLQEELLGGISRCHPNLVQVHTSGRDYETKLYYLEMELVEGRHLGTWFEGLRPEDISSIAEQLASAVEFLEKAEYFHRDIKPDNIIYEHRQSPVLLDFGVVESAKSQPDTLSTEGFVVTTVYAPPEMLKEPAAVTNDKSRWHAVNIYQIGAVLWEILEGKRYLRDQRNSLSVQELVSYIISLTDSPPITRVGPPRLIELVNRCLSPQESVRANVSWEEFVDQSLRPTVVILYAGGTIGSVRRGDSLSVIKYDSRHHPDLRDLSHELLGRYQLFYNLGSAPSVDLQWEIVSLEHQIFSENADPNYWNAVSAAIESTMKKYVSLPTVPRGRPITDFPDLAPLYRDEREQWQNAYGTELTESRFFDMIGRRYLLGVIVLTGTDTLAFTASAVAFGLRNLPCTVIVTGSNQPLDRYKEHNVRYPKYRRSDAWTNLLTAVYFLQSFGHRLTEVMVCFDGTIHLAINLRKSAVESLPLYRSDVTLGDVPFRFRNIGLRRQYMFRLVDGVFCNNYYPIGGTDWTTVVSEEFLHVRQEPYGGLRYSSLRRESFSANIGHVQATPSFCGVRVPKHEAPMAVVIEGFDAHTLPTARRTGFGAYLRQILGARIPVAVVTRYGGDRKRALYSDELNAREQAGIVPLFGVTAETAVPLVNVALSLKAPENLNLDFARRDTVRVRASKLEKRIRLLFENWTSVLYHELGDVTGLEVQSARAGKVDAKDRSARSRRDGAGDGWKLAREALESMGEQYCIVPRNDLHEDFFEQYTSYQSVGAGPDAFSGFLERGITKGFADWAALGGKLRKSRDVEWEDLQEDERSQLAKAAQAAITFVLTNLSLSRTVQIDEARVHIADENREGVVELEVDSIRKAWSLDGEEFAVESYEGREEDFFSSLRGSGWHEEGGNGRFLGATRGMWQKRIDLLDWWMLGICKALVIETACWLKIDPLAMEFSITRSNPAAVLSMRHHIRTRVIVGNENQFRFILSYRGASLPEVLGARAPDALPQNDGDIPVRPRT